MLLAVFTIYPPAGFLQSKTFLAIGYNIYFISSNYYSLWLPTIKVKAPLAAATTPPDTGASINLTLVSLLNSTISSAAETPIVEQSIILPDQFLNNPLSPYNIDFTWAAAGNINIIFEIF